MMHAIYNLSIRFYVFAILIASSVNKKARLWSKGRVNWKQKLKEWRIAHPGDLVWFHCASLGEFEQGRTVMEGLRKRNPGKLIALTFFSPSGFEVRKNYNGADIVLYLPADTPSNARIWFEILNPSTVFFVKYEYWANYFFQSRKRNIPLYMISAILRPDQRFFGRASAFWKKVLGCVTHFFVQNNETADLLRKLKFENFTLAGDTRFDRVVEISRQPLKLEEIAQFRSNSFCLVVGSSWPAEEDMTMLWYEKNSDKNITILLVPHDIHQDAIQKLNKSVSGAITWTKRSNAMLNNCRFLIIDQVGMLSSIYQFADVAMIGGGFGKGIHNILEAAVYGVPVLFGPNYKKFNEAVELIAQEGAFSFDSVQEFDALMNEFLSKKEKRIEAGEKAGAYVHSRTGATDKILNYCFKQN